MPTNLELKVKLKGNEKIKNLLAQIGVRRRNTLKQKDIYYSITGGLLKLRIENGSESLIFYNRDESGKNRWSEFEYIKFDGKGGERFFNKIFKIETVVQKRRDLFYYDNTRIHLDNVKSLGNFLELETLVLQGKSDAQRRFNKIIKLLNLDQSNQIRKSYRDLMLERKLQL